MPHSKAHGSKKTKQLPQKTSRFSSFLEILGRISVVLFVGLIGLFLVRQDSFLQQGISQTPFLFVFQGQPSDWGVQSIPADVHGAANNSQFDYLFADGDNSSNQGVMDFVSNQKTGAQSPVSTVPFTGLVVSGSNIDELGVFDFGTGNYQGSMTGNFVDRTSSGGNVAGFIPANVSSGTSISGSSLVSGNSGIIVTSVYRSCVTPWGEIVKHAEFVIAYQQRTDVNSVCNVQKRYCNNGKLLGTYSQKSCLENLPPDYIIPDPYSYNQQKISDLVQPGKPVNAGAQFDVHGKLITGSNNGNNPIDTWPAGQNPSSPKLEVYVNQTLTSGSGCVTPWGNFVPNGQFVKAYKSSLGLLDLPCEVEIRLCVKSLLKGSFQNQICNFKNMTYRDYIVENTSTNTPTVSDLLNTVNTQETKDKQSSSTSFWTWLGSKF